MTIARFSSSDTVEEGARVRACSSKAMVAKKAAPMRQP